MKKYALSCVNLENGITVYNREERESKHYPVVAHIDICGAVKLYDASLPETALKTIERRATLQMDEFRRWMLALSPANAYEQFGKRLDTDEFIVLIKNQENKKLVAMGSQAIYKRYVETICQKENRIMPRELHARMNRVAEISTSIRQVLKALMPSFPAERLCSQKDGKGESFEKKVISEILGSTNWKINGQYTDEDIQKAIGNQLVISLGLY